jgi:type I restriction enzyme S subunit
MKKEVSKEMSAFVYFMMKCFFEPQKMGGTRGSSIPYIVMNDIILQSFPFNEDIVMKFSRIAYDILLKTIENEQESRRLASLCDALLPRLMSGEL